MPQWLEKLKEKPAIAHLWRMQERFTARLGNQFAGAITYFSVLSIVPVLMFGFSVLGMVLTVLRPDLLDTVRDLISGEFKEAPLGTQVIGIMENALRNWASLGIVAIAVFAWSGANWVANLKSAIRAQLGIGMVSRGEVGLIVGSAGLASGLLSANAFSAVISMVLVTTLVTPPLLRWSFQLQARTAAGVQPANPAPGIDED